jgi:hypothetical protein
MQTDRQTDRQTDTYGWMSIVSASGSCHGGGGRGEGRWEASPALPPG